MNHVADAHKGFTYYSVSKCMLMLEVFSLVILLKLFSLLFTSHSHLILPIWGNVLRPQKSDWVGSPSASMTGNYL